jgi:hypothetical protein
MINARSAFFRKLGRELEPLATHAAAALLLDVFLLAIALLLRVVARLEPEHKDLLSQIEVLDILFTLIVSSLFGLYAIAILGIRFFYAIKLEHHESARKYQLENSKSDSSK